MPTRKTASLRLLGIELEDDTPMTVRDLLPMNGVLLPGIQ